MHTWQKITGIILSAVADTDMTSLTPSILCS